MAGHPDPAPTVRLLAAIPRSGSTLAAVLMAHAIKDARLTARTLLMTRRYESHNAPSNHFQPDYSLYDRFFTPRPHLVYGLLNDSGARILVTKEEFGNNISIGQPFENECSYKLFRGPADVQTVRPVFIYRHPLAAWRSWRSLGWTRPRGFILCYCALASNHAKARAVLPDTPALIYERLISSRASCQAEISRVCAHWKVPMLPDRAASLPDPFLKPFLFWDPREEAIYNDSTSRLFNTLHRAQSVNFGVKVVAPPSDGNEEDIARICLPIYEAALSLTALPETVVP